MAHFIQISKDLLYLYALNYIARVSYRIFVGEGGGEEAIASTDSKCVGMHEIQFTH